jgi:ABC-2 type transport system ATP-binding protein
VTAVDNLSFEVKDGEMFGLLGPNGAGKTTTLLILVSAVLPTSGTVFVNGFDVVKMPNQVRREVGISFQEPVLDPRLTVKENLEFHADACGIQKDECRDRIREVLECLNMWEDRNKKAGKLSGGMKRKTEDAKLFIQRPRVAVFDEPTAFLDVSSRHEVWRLMKSMQENATTIILATNMMDEADKLSERIGIISKGRLIVLGSPDEMKNSIPKGQIMDLKVNGEVEVVAEILREFPEIQTIQIIKDANTARLYMNEIETVLPRIMSVLFKKNVNINSVDFKKPSLEDVFLHYTGQVLGK